MAASSDWTSGRERSSVCSWRRRSEGGGISRILLGALEDAARGLRYQRVQLDTGSEQYEAQKLYPSAGYAEIADYNGNPYASVWFEKEL